MIKIKILVYYVYNYVYYSLLVYYEAVRVKKGHIPKFWGKFECQAILPMLDFKEGIHILIKYYL